MKNVLVTGATGDIGQAIARELAGYKVIVHYNSNRDIAEMLAAEINGLAVQADITNPESVAAMFEQIKNSVGEVDALINNAGVQSIKMLIDTDYDEWKRVLDTNLTGAYLVTRQALKQMMWHGGKIVNISSVWGQCGGACEVAYSASKAGLIGFTRALAKEYTNINVNCVCPGCIESKMNSHLSEEEKNELLQSIPCGRFGLPEEVAHLVRFLTSDEANYITGQTIALNGGMYI